MSKYLFIVITILTCVSLILFNRLNKQIDENNRLINNEYSLNDSIKKYKIRDSVNVFEIKDLNYTINEMIDLRKSDVKLIEDLNVRLKTVEYITTLKTEIKYIVKDTVIYKSDILSNIHIDNKWIKLNIDINKNAYNLNLNTLDSLAIIGHKERPKKFLFIRYGKWNYFVKIVNFNPYGDIKYFNKIVIGKRNKK